MSEIPTLQRPATFDHLRSRKKPMVKRVTICLDPDLAAALDEARSEHDVAKVRYETKPTDAERATALETAEAALAEATQAVEAEAVTFVFKGLGRRRYDDLISAHPPTEDQRKKHKRQTGGDLEWDPEKFPVAVVAASLVEPHLTVDQVAELWNDDTWNSAELMELFWAAINVNQQRRVVDLGKG